MPAVIRLFRAEVLKLWTLPEVWLTFVATVLAAAVVAVTILVNNAAIGVTSVVACIQAVPDYAVLGIAVLGVLASTSEYRGNQIHTSLTATPKRSGLAAAKLTVFVLTCGVFSFAAMGAAGMAIRAIGDPQAHAMILRACVHLTAMGVIAMAVGMAARSLVGSLTAAIIVLVVAPPVVEALAPLAATWLPSLASAGLLLNSSGSRRPLDSSAVALSAWILGVAGIGYARLAWSDG
nr:hypothetical protein [Propionicimonas sp.]